MADKATYDQIEAAANALADAKALYLIAYGWERTCDTPASMWLWSRDFSDFDAERLARWERSPDGPIKRACKPKPVGRITASLNVAVTMTRSGLDATGWLETDDEEG